jgi:twitching motility protein PilJ
VRKNAPEGYDPLASVSIMEQLRTATSEMRVPRKLPLVGNLPVLQQFQVLGVMALTFLVFAAIMMFLESRNATQHSAAAATATEMQMLSQRLARGTALAAQGQATAFAAVKDSRDRFKADLNALVAGGTVRGVDLDVTQDPATFKMLQDIQARWERVDANAGRLLDNQQSLTSLAKGLEGINQGNNGILELAQQAAQQVGQAGGSLREIEYTNQLAVLSQRIAKNANALASSDEIDPEVAFLLGKDAGTTREILNGLLKGSDTLRLSPLRNEEARATLAELSKRFAVYDGGVNAILQNMNRLVAAKQAARGVNAESEALLADTTQLAAEYESGATPRGFARWAAVAFGLFGLACLLLLG